MPRRCGVRRNGATKLDPYKPIIDEGLTTYPALSAVRLLAEVTAAGTPAASRSSETNVALVRPHPESEPVIRFETVPGHQAQVDFAEFRFPWGRRVALLVVLG